MQHEPLPNLQRQPQKHRRARHPVRHLCGPPDADAKQMEQEVMTPTQRAAAQQAERAAFEAWVAKVQPAYWRVEAWQTEAWSMWQSISAALAEQPAPPPECQTEAEKTAYAFGWFKAMEAVREKKVEHPAEQEPEGAVCGRCGGLVFDPVIPQSAKPAEQRSDGMPNSSNERHLRRLLAVRVGMPNTYYDDGEAQGYELGVAIDFLREPVADIDAKLRALNVARAAMAEQPAKQPLTDEEIDALWAKQQTKPFKTHSEDRMAFASAVIAAYERKNGIGEAK